MNMHNSTKAAHSSAIRAEVKRHDSLQKTLIKVLKQLERVEDQQLRSGLKLYVHSVQGKSHSRSVLFRPTRESAPARRPK